MNRKVFITGATGYIGRRIIPMLIEEGYQPLALVRQSSVSKLPANCDFIVANPFEASTFREAVKGCSTFIQLLGVRKPGPSKKELFYSIDLPSVHNSVMAARDAKVEHFIYLSIAQTPTRIMKDYQDVRKQGEELIRSSGLRYTFLRPWYVIGPGHYWPLVFLPFMKLMEWIPATSSKAKALRLIYLKNMLESLMDAVKNPPTQQGRIIEIEDIKKQQSNIR